MVAIPQRTAAGAPAVLSTAQDHRVPDVRAGDKPWCPLEIDLDDSASIEGSLWDSSTNLLANLPMSDSGRLCREFRVTAGTGSNLKLHR